MGWQGVPGTPSGFPGQRTVLSSQPHAMLGLSWCLCPLQGAWALTSVADQALGLLLLGSLVVGDAPDHRLLVAGGPGLGGGLRCARSDPQALLLGLLRFWQLCLGDSHSCLVPQALAGAGVLARLLAFAPGRVLGDRARFRGTSVGSSDAVSGQLLHRVGPMAWDHKAPAAERGAPGSAASRSPALDTLCTKPGAQKPW